MALPGLKASGHPAKLNAGLFSVVQDADGLTDMVEPGVGANHPRLLFATSAIAHAETGRIEGALIAGEAAAAAFLKGSSHV